MAWEREITHSPATGSYWAAQAKYSDTLVQEATGVLGASRVTFNYSRTTPTGTREDWASFTMHLAVHVGGASYASLSNTQKADAETDLLVFATAVKNLQSNAFTLINLTWHDVVAGDKFYGPSDRITTQSLTSTNTDARQPDQLAANCTLRTASRKHWGRFYLPGISSSCYERTYGRITNSICDTIASSTRTLMLDLEANTASTKLVVWSHQHEAILTVDEIHCDNVPDIIRRRRAKMASYRKSFAA